MRNVQGEESSQAHFDAEVQLELQPQAQCRPPAEAGIWRPAVLGSLGFPPDGGAGPWPVSFPARLEPHCSVSLGSVFVFDEDMAYNRTICFELAGPSELNSFGTEMGRHRIRWTTPSRRGRTVRGVQLPAGAECQPSSTEPLLIASPIGLSPPVVEKNPGPPMVPKLAPRRIARSTRQHTSHEPIHPQWPSTRPGQSRTSMPAASMATGSPRRQAPPTASSSPRRQREPRRRRTRSRTRSSG
jgi:hypothetical protein